MVEAKIDDKLRKDAKPIKGGGLYKSGMNKKVMGDRAVVARRNLNAAPKKGGMTDSMTAQAERQKVHQSKRGVKKGMGEAYVVNQADKTGNTPAYQGYKAGKKNKLTGEPLYKKGNMKEASELKKTLKGKPKKKYGRGEKIGRVVGGIGGSIGGGLAGGAAGATGPGAIAGGTAGGVAGDYVGTKVGGADW